MSGRSSVRVISIIVAALLVLSAWRAGAALAAADAKALRELGSEALRNKRYAAEIEFFTGAIKQNKGEISIEIVATIFSDRGLAYVNLQQYDAAMDDFGNAIRLEGGNAVFYNNRGLVHLTLRRFDDALEDFTKAITLSPGSAAYYNNRGMVHLRRQDPGQAIEDFTRAVQYDPQNAQFHGNRGLAYKSRLLYDKALRDFDKALEIAPKDPSAGYQKAAIFALLGKIDASCIWLEIAAGNGYGDWAAVKNNRDFDGIRKTDCYRKLMAGK